MTSLSKYSKKNDKFQIIAVESRKLNAEETKQSIESVGGRNKNIVYAYNGWELLWEFARAASFTHTQHPDHLADHVMFTFMTVVKDNKIVYESDYIHSYAQISNIMNDYIDMPDLAACKAFGFCEFEGKYYWFENGIRQGTYDDKQGVMGDGTIRGREIYDPESDGWYWLDSIYDGAKAIDKEVWMPYVYQDEKNWSDAEIHANAMASNSYSEDKYAFVGEMGDQIERAIREGRGKWVRYDRNGKMFKGLISFIKPDGSCKEYYFDYKTGAMAKGWTDFGGVRYYFDEITGVLDRSR